LITIVRKNAASSDSNHVGVVSIPDGKVTDLELVGTGARFAAPNHIIFATAGGLLWAAEFSRWRRTITGDRVRLADGVHTDFTGAADVAVSRNGTVLYGEMASRQSRAGGRSFSLAIVGRDGAIKTLTPYRGDYSTPRVSPDEAHIALTGRESATQMNVWIYEMATGQLKRLTHNGTSANPEWLDAKRIVYRDGVTPVGRFMLIPWDLSAVEQPFLNPSGNLTYTLSLGPPAGHLAVMRSRSPASGLRQDIATAPMKTPDVLNFAVSSPAREMTPRVSPNGKWLAFTSDSSGTLQLYVQPLPGSGPRVPVSIDNGIEPVWSRDGRELYYVSRGRLLAAHVDETTGFRVTKQDTLFSFTDRGFRVTQPANGATRGFYDVFKNGDFAVLGRSVVADSTRTNVIAVLHWQRLLNVAPAPVAKR
jgi:hypothetical protein